MPDDEIDEGIRRLAGIAARLAPQVFFDDARQHRAAGEHGADFEMRHDAIKLLRLNTAHLSPADRTKQRRPEVDGVEHAHVRDGARADGERQGTLDLRETPDGCSAVGAPRSLISRGRS